MFLLSSSNAFFNSKPLTFNSIFWRCAMFKSLIVARKAFVLSLFVFGWTVALLLTTYAGNLDGTNPGQRQAVIETLNRMPLAFTENQGQFGDRTRFRANTPQSSFFFLPGEVIYQFTRRYQDEDSYLQLDKWRIDDFQSLFVNKVERFYIKAKFIGANPNPEIVGEGSMDYRCNYFIGNDPAEWRREVPNYSAVRYTGIYPGIDLRYYGDGRVLEYDFIIKPGADPSRIKIEYEGMNSLSVNGEGELMVSTRFGDVIERVPYAYQKIGSDRREIPCRYVITDRERFGFVLDGDYDGSQPLYIDPELTYGTFLGGSSNDRGIGIAVDDSGYAYITGDAESSNFPTTPGAFDQSHNGNRDAFVTKLNLTGSALVYSTFLGGEYDEAGRAIVVDKLRNAYVTGETNSSNFPTTPGAYDQTQNGSGDVWVAKLNPSGSALVYSTFIGSSIDEVGYGIAVDDSGKAYVTGTTFSPNFPTTAGAYDQTHNGAYDVFVTKLNATGSALVYSTFLGGSGYDMGYGIACDDSGKAYVTGWTASSGFPTTAGAYDQTLDGNSDAFVTKLNQTGSTLVYSTFLGGSGDDGSWDIALDNCGNAYVAGSTVSSNFPTTAGAYDQTYNGNGDVFVTRLNSTGSALSYSTFLGGSDGDVDRGIALDEFCNAYLTGYTSSANFPTTPDAFDTTYNSNNDIFITKLSPLGDSLVYSTFLGGSGDESGGAGGGDIAIDDYRNAYVTGNTGSANFPTTTGAFDQIYNGGTYDAFVAKFELAPAPVGFWRLDEGSGSTAYDETNNNNDGTITGASWTTGFSGSALYFHGGGQFFDGDGVTVPHSSSLDINGEFTVEAWIKATGSDQFLAIVDKYRYESGIEYGFTLYLDYGRIRLTVYSASHGQRTIIGISDLRDNTWHHVAGTLGDGYIRVFVDCQMEGETAWTCPPASTTNNLGIGKRLSGHGGYMPFLGSIDEVRIYSSGSRCGDVNADGAINASDVVYLINYLFIPGSPAPIPIEAGDVNCDGKVNASDVVYLTNYLFISGPAPCY
jgi:hypothetical protein